MLVQYRKSWINRLGGEWLTEAQVGQDTHLFSEFYQPLHEPGIWFGSLYGAVGQTTRGVFNGDDKVAEYLVGSARAGVDLGAPLGTFGSVRVGAQWTQVHARVDTGDPVLPSVKRIRRRAAASVHRRPARSRVVPAGRAIGERVATTAPRRRWARRVNYQRLAGSGTFVKSWGAHTLNSVPTAAPTSAPACRRTRSFSLGGPLRLSGFRLGQFAGREYAFARVMYYRRVLPLPDLLGSGLYTGASAEVGKIRNSISGLPSPGTLYSGSLFIGGDTFVGPAYLGFGVGNDGSASGYLLFGAP